MGGKDSFSGGAIMLYETIIDGQWFGIPFEFIKKKQLTEEAIDKLIRIMDDKKDEKKGMVQE